MPRLLRKRREFGELTDQTVATSITAFMGWKAFLIVARGSHSGAEKAQCEATTVTVLNGFPELWQLTETFANRLRALRQESLPTAADWYCDPSWDQDQTEGRVRWAMRTIKELNEALTAGKRTPAVASLISDHVYAMRSAVLAHTSVQSTGNLFQHIVPSFEALVCALACGGYAARAKISLDQAKTECNV